MLLFFFYICMDESFYFHIQDFLLSSSTFHIYTFTIFIEISLSVIHPCEMVIISVTHPQTWLILMFNNGQTLHFVRPQTRLLQVFKALIQTFPHPQYGYALYLLCPLYGRVCLGLTVVCSRHRLFLIPFFGRAGFHLLTSHLHVQRIFSSWAFQPSYG